MPTRYSPAPRKPSKPFRIPRWVGISVALLGVASVSATAGALLAISLSSQPLMQAELSAAEADIFGQGEPISTGGKLRLPRLTRPVNILVLGLKVLSSDVTNPPPEVEDLGYHALVNSFEGLSDTMLLVRFNPHTEQLVVLSIPRDTRARVQGQLTKLNEANREGGPALAARSISNMLGGVAIDRYVRINVQGVEKLVDALGGVTVNVPKDMKYQDDSQHLYINLKAGEQRLDGDQAMQFLRFRYDEKGDIGRIQRQQMLMRAIVEQALNPATIGRLPNILSVIQSHVDTNLSVEELLALVGFAAQTNASGVQMLMLPGDFSSPNQFNLSYWLPNYAAIDEMIDQYFGFGVQPAVSSEPASLRIAIQDSTGDAVAVQSLIDTLNDSGYYNVYSDRAWHDPLPITRIVAQRGDLASAEMIHRFLGVGEVRVESTGDLQSDITIRLGNDWLLEHGDQL
ncbi:Transcriptional regulator LytR [Halomicronema hongdechloris C2206]|uniref:Transcriptional regulator LytR n=1 Tax=Halomicronema hongdechloris C2206 TaxID=1641165 RepID=A0A1Z3HJZ1_9CYAN|nr:LCP family protein [Halomicronema hongdechloris]ASC70576.1 Transcriptional regulator LytR [Halomicronema hongdechloris C2206]